MKVIPKREGEGAAAPLKPLPAYGATFFLELSWISDNISLFKCLIYSGSIHFNIDLTGLVVCNFNID